MTINQIRENLAIKISNDEAWVDELNDSSPGHYGVIYSDVDISAEDIRVDIESETFKFKDVDFEFELQLGSSNREDGSQLSFTRTAKGEGTFVFSEDGNDIEIEDLKVEFNLDLFDD